MPESMNDALSSALISKSKEAVYLAVEIMNKPTIHYRTEGFCFFICNAWELMLKAFLVREKGPSSIDLPSKPGSRRTKSFYECIRDVFTSDDNPVRNNLEIILKMRNRATHAVSSADDIKYAPGYQRCVDHYFAFLKKHFPKQGKTEMTPFISLAVGGVNTDAPILVEPQIETFFTSGDDAYAPMLKGRLVFTKKESEADFKAYIEPRFDVGLVPIEVAKDLQKTHPYTQKTAVQKIKEMIAANGFDGGSFNKYSFGRIKKDLKLENNSSYCYKDTHYKNPCFYYSDEVVDLVVSRFLNDQAFRDKYKAKNRN